MVFHSADHTSSKPKQCRIVEGDGALVDVHGYVYSFHRTVLSYIGYFLTLGILRLILHWFPDWLLKCTNSKCELPEAQKVLIKDSFGVVYVEDVHRSKLTSTRLDMDSQYSSKCTTEDHFHLDESGAIVFFIHKKLKYVMDSSGIFNLLTGWEERAYGEVIPAQPLSWDTAAYRRCLYGSNEIAIHLTPISTLLFNECLSPFYCFQVISCILWYLEEYWTYATCIVVVSAISLLSQVYETRRNEIALKKTVCGTSAVTVCRESSALQDFYEIDSIDLVPGDVIEIPRTGCVMQCDALLLTGSCIVNENTLTGESVPVTKTQAPDRQPAGEVFRVSPYARHVLFGGTTVIQTRNYADEKVLAVVIRTGFRTAKGELVRSILYPRPIKFKFTQDALKFVGALSVLAVIGFVVSILLMHRSDVSSVDMVFRALDLITIVVPPALPVAMTVGIVFAQRRLRSHGIYCINPSVINVCAVVNLVCFDKTGTLTEDGLDLWGVVPNEDGHFGEPQFDPSNLIPGPLLESMAACHSLTRIDGVLSGDPLDLKMFQSTKWEFIEEVSEDHCKFEMAVPAVVRPVPKEAPSSITLDSSVDVETFPYEVGIVRQFPFTSGLQRMSVIARVLNSSHFNVYTKGAPEMIESLCRCDTVPMDFHSTLLDYTREGYRVLALAWRPLKLPYNRILRVRRQQVERDLFFLGLLVMDNRLKPETTPAIATLRQANIRPVMVTGDNMLTALSVARDCEMIDELDRVILVSAKPPPPQGASVHIVSEMPDAHGDPVILPRPTDPLVEFHYAEDLHKPVTEVTATEVGREGDGQRWKGKNGVGRGAAKHRFRPFRTTRNDATELPEAVADGENGHTRVGFVGRDILLPRPFTIRMLDRPDFHFAISGKTWAVIREHYPWLISKLVVKGTVFARFSPDQKAQLVEALQSVGYFVAMCGDGANDCGALKAAHAGIALSEAEASVASPFTAKQQHIGCVPTLIREGRCALVTSFGIFKFMAAYSLVQFFSVTLMYSIGSCLYDTQFLYIDFFLITSLSVTFGYTKAYKWLSMEPPNMRLLSTVTLLSLCLQLFVAFLLQAVAFVLVRIQPWYSPMDALSQSEGYECRNFENTAVFIVSVYQYLILAVTFAKGVPFRKPFYTNGLFIVNILICLAATLYLTTYPAKLILDLFELLRLPSAQFVVLLHACVLANFLLSYLLELLTDGLAFRRRLRHIRRVLFPKHVESKMYERIREEIDRLGGAWPPIIRSASVQALPRDLFTDHAPQRPSGRRRQISSMSTETEGEDQDTRTAAAVDHKRNRHSSETRQRRHSFDGGIWITEFGTKAPQPDTSNGNGSLPQPSDVSPGVSSVSRRRSRSGCVIGQQHLVDISSGHLC